MNDMIRTSAMCVIEGAFFLYHGQSFVVTKVIGGCWEQIEVTDSRGNVYQFNGLSTVEVDCISSLVPSHSGTTLPAHMLIEG